MERRHYSDLEIVDSGRDGLIPFDAPRAVKTDHTEHSDFDPRESSAFVPGEPVGAKSRHRICGLKPTIFWVVVICVFLTVGGAIGGGIGGTLAAQDSNKSGVGNAGYVSLLIQPPSMMTF